MTNYSVLLTDGWRAECSGKRIGQAMRNLAKKRPDLVPMMTATFETYINGTAYYWKSSEESRKTLKALQKVKS